MLHLKLKVLSLQVRKWAICSSSSTFFFFPEPCQVPGQKCQHCHGFCSWAAISLKCAISMHIYAGLSEISIPRTAKAWGDQVCLLCFSQVDWKIRNKREGLLRQSNKKKFAHFPHPSFFLTWWGLVKSIGIFLFWGGDCYITCTSFCCLQRKVPMIFDIWAHSVSRFRCPQCSSEETICCELPEQARLCLCYTLCSLHFSVSANEEY